MRKDIFKKNLKDKMTNVTLEPYGVYSNTPKIIEIELEKIEFNPHQPRLEYDEKKLEELVKSINKQGLISPIVVRKKENKYEIIAGHRRYLAFKKLNKEIIPVIVKRINDRDMQTLALIENIIRENLDPLEISIALENLLLNNIAKTQNELADLLGLNESTISRYLKLLTLPEDIKNKIKKREYTNLIVLNKLAKFPNNEAVNLFNIILEKNLNREDALELIKNANKLERENRNIVFKGRGFKIEKKDISTKIEINFNKIQTDREKIDTLLKSLEEVLKSCTVQD